MLLWAIRVLGVVVPKLRLDESRLVGRLGEARDEAQLAEVALDCLDLVVDVAVLACM